MSAPVRSHPAWCDLGRCQWAIQGPHESRPIRVAADNRGARMLMLLWQQPGDRIRLRIVAIGSMLVNEVDLDIATAGRAQSAIEQLLSLAAQPVDLEPASNGLEAVPAVVSDGGAA